MARVGYFCRDAAIVHGPPIQVSPHEIEHGIPPKRFCIPDGAPIGRHQKTAFVSQVGGSPSRNTVAAQTILCESRLRAIRILQSEVTWRDGSQY